jgi:hypothetical protein
MCAQELHMDGYSNLTYSSMLPLVETFKSLRVLHLEVRPFAPVTQGSLEA